MIVVRILLDDEDADIAKWIAHIRVDGPEGYGKPNTTLHRIIADRMGLPETTTENGLVVDHINNNKLDNRRCNLEVITQSENKKKSKRRNAKTGYYGVVPAYKRFFKVVLDQYDESVRIFDTPEEAAREYDKMAYNKYGIRANLNFPAEYLRHEEDTITSKPKNQGNTMDEDKRLDLIRKATNPD